MFKSRESGHRRHHALALGRELKRPRGISKARSCLGEMLFSRGQHIRKTSSGERFHADGRNALRAQFGKKRLGSVGPAPVDAVYKYRHHIPLLRLQEIVHEILTAMERKSEMTDAPLRLLFAEVVDRSGLNERLYVILLMDERMKHINVEIPKARALKLLLEDTLGVGEA